MSEAPERIMAYGEINTKWGVQFKCHPMPMQGMPPFPHTEYVRADRIEELEAKLAQQDDLVQAAVAAALREAAALFEQDALDMRAEENTLYWTAENDAKRILALITPDAQAALDRVVADAVKAERDECVGAVRAFFGNLYDEDEWTMEELVAAIRKGGE